MDRYGRYKLTLCAHCDHPGGQHYERSQDPAFPHCQLCVSCPGWEVGGIGLWSDHRTDSEREKAERQMTNYQAGR